MVAARAATSTTLVDLTSNPTTEIHAPKVSAKEKVLLPRLRAKSYDQGS